MINGYKMLKDTPVVSQKKSKFMVPQTPEREELGVLLANQSQIKKRQIKEQEKIKFNAKLDLSSGTPKSARSTQSQKFKKTPFSQAGKELLGSL